MRIWYDANADAPCANTNSTRPTRWVNTNHWYTATSLGRWRQPTARIRPGSTRCVSFVGLMPRGPALRGAFFQRFSNCACLDSRTTSPMDVKGGTAVSRDRDLVESAQRGDQSAFMDLVHSRGDRLFAIAFRILRDVDRAEDALQDALVIAWRDLRTLRDPDRFDAWAGRLLTNVCITHATRERRRTANLRLLPPEGPAGP